MLFKRIHVACGCKNQIVEAKFLHKTRTSDQTHCRGRSVPLDQCLVSRRGRGRLFVNKMVEFLFDYVSEDLLWCFG